MPKIIDRARERIVRSAGRLLLEGGYTAFTLRAVAADCSMAVGTIYNYFPNKNMLVAAIMIDDWFAALDQMGAGIAAAGVFGEGLRAVFDAITAFKARYEPVWQQFNSSSAEPGLTRDRHLMLRGQLSKQLEPLLERFAPGYEPELLPLFTEMLLAAALQSDIGFEPLVVAAKRLFPAKKEVIPSTDGDF